MFFQTSTSLCLLGLGPTTKPKSLFDVGHRRGRHGLAEEEAGLKMGLLTHLFQGPKYKWAGASGDVILYGLATASTSGRELLLMAAAAAAAGASRFLRAGALSPKLLTHSEDSRLTLSFGQDASATR